MNTDITLRDYLAAHAPAEPQAWFQPETSPRPIANPEWHWCDQCKGDWGHCTHEADCDEIRAYRRQDAEWLNQWNKACQLQWPYAWADAMLAERNRRGTKPSYEELVQSLTSLAWLIDDHEWEDANSPDVVAARNLIERTRNP